MSFPVDRRRFVGRFFFFGSGIGFALSLVFSLAAAPPAPASADAAARGGDPGGMIMIHGLPNGLGWLGEAGPMIDWTEGCIAVTNAATEDTWRRVPNGTPIEIRS